MFSFKLIYFVIFILNLCGTKCQISDKRMCIDKHCTEPVSIAKTLHRYSSPDPLRLSFPPNVNITIYSKEAGNETSLWGAELNGKRGYIPKFMVRETKVFKKPTLLVDTELVKPQVPEKTIEETPVPNKVQESFEVVDGTTIYTGANIEPSSTASSVFSTATPNNEVKNEENTDKNIAEEPSNSAAFDVMKTLTDWMKDDENDEDENETDEDDEDQDDDDEEEEEEESDKNEQSESDTSNLTKAKTKFKTHSLEIDDHKKNIDDLTQNNHDNVEKNSLGDDNNVVPQGKQASLNTESLNEKSDVPPLGNELEKQESEEIKTATTTIPEMNQEIAPPIEQEETVTVPSIKEEPIIPPQEETVTSSPIKEEAITPLQEETVTPLPSAQEPITPLSIEEKPITPLSIEEEAKPPQNEEIVNSAEIEVKPTSAEDTTASAPVMKEPLESDKINLGSGNLPEIDTNVQKIGELDGNRDIEKTDTKKETFTETNHSSEIIEDKTIQQNMDHFYKDSKDTLRDSTDDLQQNKELINEDKIIEQTDNDVPSPPSSFLFTHVLNTNSEETTEQPNSDYNVDNSYNTDNLVTNQESKEIDIDQDGTYGSEIYVNPNIEQTETVSQENYEKESNKIPADPVAQIDSNNDESENGGIFSGIFSFFSSDKIEEPSEQPEEKSFVSPPIVSVEAVESEDSCNADNIDCKNNKSSYILEEIGIHFNSDFFLYLITTAISCTIFLFVYLLVDKHRRVSPLIAKINKLEKELLVSLKENELLREKGEPTTPIFEINTNTVPNEIVEELKRQLLDVQLMKENLEVQLLELHKEIENKQALELQIESLEKELETSTEVGLELNRIISEMLNPENGSDILKENVEQLQRQLLEQKDTINKINATLSEKEEENSDLIAEVEMSKKKSLDLQNKLDEMVDKIIQVENERDEQQKALQNEISIYQRKYNELAAKDDALNKEIKVVRSQFTDVQRQLDLKIKEYQNLKENISNINSLQNNNEALTSIFDTVSMKAEYDQLKGENERYVVELQQAQLDKDAYEKNCQRVLEEMGILKEKYEEADKEKVEVNMKLEVLNNYFKKREAELQEEVLKFKSIWDAKEGEATSTTERIRLLKEEIENYKSQNETMKQEIISQEIDLKSQISVLEKKVHENWIQARQTERRLEDARQEAAQLRNRLTLRERAIDERAQNRLQSPLEQNGDLTTFSPHPIDSPASPPLLYSRDHMTKSPPVPGLPFLPPPPGAPFLPPPPLPGLAGLPPFVPMPPPPLFPGDRRPPPLGRMSSPPPPLNSRYSPDTSAFSPYDRNTPSPPYDSEYGASPPPLRGYSPYRDDRRDYKRLPPPPHIRSNGRNAKGSLLSSGSDRSNESLDKINRNQSKMV